MRGLDASCIRAVGVPLLRDVPFRLGVGNRAEVRPRIDLRHGGDMQIYRTAQLAARWP